MFEYINETYGVDARIGGVVSVDGEPGVIKKDKGNYIGVEFDNKPGIIQNCHPTWRVVYSYGGEK